MAQSQVFRGVARSVVNVSPTNRVFMYHSTPIVDVFPQAIVLNSGGWRTATTKLAMNQASNQYGLGFLVYQDKGVWYVRYRGVRLTFYDGMILQR